MTSAAVSFVLLMSAITCWANELIRCRSGQLKYNDICRQCPPHTCMPDDNHTNTACYDCFTENSIKHRTGMQITSPCNSTHQAVVGCKDNYFYTPDSHPRTSPGECDRCRNCLDDATRPYEIQKCSGNHDTECCERPNMVAVMVGDEYQCQGRDAGSTDSKPQGPDYTEKGDLETSTADVTGSLNTTLPTLSEEKGKFAPWIIAVVVPCAGVPLIAGVIYCVYKKVRKSQHSKRIEGDGNMEMAERNGKENTKDSSEFEPLKSELIEEQEHNVS